MSNLLEQASLVMIPSGYKEDVVYSEIPLNGAGDLSFTRASNGTRINSAGLVEVVPWNLLQYSNAFNTAPWSMNVTSGQAGKDGQNNAWLLTKLGSTTSDYYNSNVYNGDQTFTIYVKKESGKGFKLYPIGTTTTNVEINLQTGVVFNQGAGITSTTVEAYSSTWWKISVALNMVNSNYYIYVTDGAGTQIAGSITIQDAQVNIGLTAKPYFPTTDRLNVPRLTYQNGGGGCPSLLLEKQSTNIITNSQTTANWSLTNMSRTANYGISPDGTQNADLLFPTTSGSVSFTSDTTTSSLVIGEPFVVSFFIKLNASFISNVGTNIFDIRLSGASVWSRPTIRVNLETGEVTNQNNASYISSTNFGNGWFRITFGATPTGTSGVVSLQAPTGSTMNGGSFYIWGLQGEANATYATSYIPTTSSSATRVADACYKTGISSLIGQTEGVLFADFVANSAETTIIAINDPANPSTNIIYIQAQIGDVWRAYVVNGGVYQVAITAGSGATGRCKMAFAYKQNDFVLYANGQLILADSSGTVPACSAFYLGYYNGAYLPLQTNEAILFPTRLTNSELASLTTI